MNHIPIIDDELIPDEALAAEWRTTRRTLWRYDQKPDGLPFVMVGGKKFRPVKACQAWLARRIRQPNPTAARRADAEAA